MRTTVGDMAGDPACWLSEVCPECGRVREGADHRVCEYCGYRMDGADAGTEVRDRDETGRARSARPRDGLGRPLPYGASGVERAAEGVARTPERTLAEAQRLLDAGMPFHAHEVLEDAWKLSAEPERGLWRGLAQLAVGVTHAMRGNTSGACSLLVRGADTIAPYRAYPPHHVDVGVLEIWARGTANEIQAGASGSATVPAVPRLRAE